MKISIIGGNGGMGKLFSSLFIESGHDVVSHGRSTNNWNEIKNSNVIIISAPKEAFGEICKKIKPFIKNQLVVSFSSYMTDDEESLNTLKADFVFIHPLFGPDIKNLEDKRIVITPTENKLIRELEKVFKKHKMNVLNITIEKHDKLMLYVQALSQFNSLALAKTLRESGFTKKELDDAATITFNLNKGVIDRLVIQKPELWADIQFSNKDFDNLLNEHLDSIKDLADITKRKDLQEFIEDFNKTKEFFKNKGKETTERILPTETKIDFENSIAILGPEGTYSHEVATKFNTEKKPVFCKTISDALRSIEEDKIQTAILPFENSIHGTVLETLDGLQKSDVKIVGEIVIDINHNVATLLPNQNPADIRKVYSHPQALAQCSEYIKKTFPNADINITPSTSTGFQKIKEEGLTDSVAIGSEFSTELYGLHTLDKNIQDEKNNQTLFVIVSKKENSQTVSPHTYISLSPEKNEAGQLHQYTSIFKELGLNLSKIESRPQRSKPGLYIFYYKIDIDSKDERYDNLIKKWKEVKIPFTIMSN
jgi:prephenate dehydratase/prephenate dehydrogenase